MLLYRNGYSLSCVCVTRYTGTGNSVADNFLSIWGGGGGGGGTEGGGILAVERKDSHYKHSEVETRASNLGFPKIYLYGGKKKFF